MTTLVRSLGLGLLLAGIAVAGWQPIDSITDRGTSDITAQSNARSVACDAAGNIHVVWRGRVAGAYQVWYSGRDATSGQWTPDTTLTSVAGGVCDPSCVLGPDRALYLCWNNQPSGMLHLLKRDSTGQWSWLDSLSGQEGDSMVSLCSDDSGTMHAAWCRGTDPTMVICYSNYQRSGWGRIDTVTLPGSYGHWPSITCSPDGTVMVVWAASSVQLLSRRRVGGEWQGIEVVYDSDQSHYPCVTWGGQSYYAAWLAGQGLSQRVLVSSWSESGWGDTMKLSAGRVGQPGVSIAAEADGALHVAWVGGDSSGPDSTHVQYRTRPSEGMWQSQLKLTAGPVNPQRVSMTADDGRVQVAWSDQQPLPRGLAVRLRRYERVHDAGVIRIVQPADTVDSGAVVQPAAWVKNYGDLPETDVPVRFSFGGYRSEELVPALAPGETASVVFDADTVAVRGWSVATCSTSLVGDDSAGNDAARDSFFIRVQDVGLDSIFAPGDTVYDSLLTPRVRVQNCGNVEANATVHARIDSSFYQDSVVIRLPPDGDSLVALGPWATIPGTFTFRCSVACAPDIRPENDTLSKRFSVVARDVGVSAILSPSGTVDSGSTVIPLALVRNYGTTAAACSVRLAVDTAYNATALVTSLVPGESALVAFDAWTPTMRGTHVVRCSTMLVGDRVPGNDMQSCSVFVRVCDAAPVAILCPAETISRGQVQPRVRLVNCGNKAENVPVRFEIVGDSQVYARYDTVAVGPGDTVEAEFPPWQAQGGTYVGVCSTALVGDMQPGNDTMRCGFRVARVDAAALAIRVPLDTISEGWVEPRVLVANHGDDPATFYAHFTCERQGSVVYRDSEFVGLDSMSQKEVTFREWMAGPGDYGLLATVMLGDDENPHNDSVSAAVYVESLESKHWRERASVPRGPWGRRVKDGGSLVAVADGLLALKGANTREWYRYSAAADSWVALADMPLGVDGHKVRAGASLCWGGNSAVFALKGTGTHEFWRYDIPGDSWHPLASLPEHTSGVRYGSGLVFVPVEDTDKVFMVKGSNTRDFLVYWVRQNEWHARRQLPPGLDSTTARRGTCLALLGGRIFCLKGRTTEFYEYSPDGDSWVERAALPRLGRGRQWKKPAKGAALASDGSRFLYAFKGGRCNEFWRYDSWGDSWSQLDDVPKGNHRRKVGHGGALAWLGGRAYALKGGGSNELWCFDPFAVLAVVPDPERGAGAEADVVQLPVARRAPVLLRCGRPVEYPVPDGAAGILVFDTSGRILLHRAATGAHVRLCIQRPGVYFVVPVGTNGAAVKFVATD